MAAERHSRACKEIMKLFILVALFGLAFAQHNPHTRHGRTSIVHLFEWRWADIAAECERYLGPNGFGGVQVRASKRGVSFWGPNVQNPPNYFFLFPGIWDLPVVLSFSFLSFFCGTRCCERANIRWKLELQESVLFPTKCTSLSLPVH